MSSMKWWQFCLGLNVLSDTVVDVNTWTRNYIANHEMPSEIMNFLSLYNKVPIPYSQCLKMCPQNPGGVRESRRLLMTLQWRHNEHDGDSKYRILGCLLNHLFRCRSKKLSKLCVPGLCKGNPTMIGPVTRKMLPFGDIMIYFSLLNMDSDSEVMHIFQPPGSYFPTISKQMNILTC